ncbi:SMI1/KNR4 family protein [Kineococcus arenarius]|uniref:SMI1/KNR4 family protein n=1 Tax=unclassified Kineococcus TaxID=2621656 RepID=UPI003D7CCC9D
MRPLTALLNRASDPLAPPVDVDFGTTEGPFGQWRRLLGQRNGFFCFNAGVHLSHAGDAGAALDLATWNAPDTWKDAYAGLADGPLWFAQDLFGRQFGALPAGICILDPETGETATLADSLDGWAEWLLSDPDSNACYAAATAWQDAFGPLAPTERLLHRLPLVLGGDNDVENIVVRDAVTCMRVRGPIAQQIAHLPDGAQIEIRVE